MVNAAIYNGITPVADLLLKKVGGVWTDLFAANPSARNYWSSRSAACVDRQGNQRCVGGLKCNCRD